MCIVVSGVLLQVLAVKRKRTAIAGHTRVDPTVTGDLLVRRKFPFLSVINLAHYFSSPEMRVGLNENRRSNILS
jgi:hypothetical protein